MFTDQRHNCNICYMKTKNQCRVAIYCSAPQCNVYLHCNATLNYTISLSRHEQVCLLRLRFERYFSQHRAM